MSPRPIIYPQTNDVGYRLVCRARLGRPRRPANRCHHSSPAGSANRSPTMYCHPARCAHLHSGCESSFPRSRSHNKLFDLNKGWRYSRSPFGHYPRVATSEPSLARFVSLVKGIRSRKLIVTLNSPPRHAGNRIRPNFIFSFIVFSPFNVLGCVNCAPTGLPPG